MLLLTIVAACRSWYARFHYLRVRIMVNLFASTHEGHWLALAAYDLALAHSPKPVPQSG